MASALFSLFLQHAGYNPIVRDHSLPGVTWCLTSAGAKDSNPSQQYSYSVRNRDRQSPEPFHFHSQLCWTEDEPILEGPTITKADRSNLVSTQGYGVFGEQIIQKLAILNWTYGRQYLPNKIVSTAAETLGRNEPTGCREGFLRPRVEHRKTS